jgi:two-component system, OmpR family, response regulator
MVHTLLLIEDDKELVKYLKDYLTSEGFSVKSVVNGSEAKEILKKIQPDLVVLDLNLPDLQGESLCKEIKKDNPHLPVIILTGKNTLNDKLNAFGIGADDYVTKPFNAEELLARIKVRLKDGLNGSVITIDNLSLDKNKIEVKRGNKIIDLTPQEFKLLEILMNNKDRVLTREMLLSKIWPNSFDLETRVIDVYISYLRKKIDFPPNKKLIHSQRGFGYCIKE